MNSKLKAQLDDITSAVRAFASIQSQAAEFSAQKLQEIIGMTSQTSAQDDVPFDSSLRTFQNFGIHAPISGALAPVTRLAINGATSGRYFEFPQLTASQNDSLFCEKDFTQKTLAKIEACVGVGIYSIRLTFADGTTSPLFGHR